MQQDPNQLIFNTFQSPFLKQDLIKVSGPEQAIAYPSPLNSRMVLFNENTDIMYIKSVDAIGQITLDEFEFKKIIRENKNGEYVSLVEFNVLKEELEDAKQLIQQLQQPKTTKRATKSSANTNKTNDVDAEEQ